MNGLDLEVRRGECFGLLGPERRRQDHHRRDPRGPHRAHRGRGRGARAALGDRCRRAARAARHHAPGDAASERLTVEEIVTLFRSFYPRGRASTRCIELVSLEEKRARVVRQALRRAEAAPRRGVRARRRPRAALPRRADHRPRSAVAPAAVGHRATACKARGGTVLLTTHYMDEAERLCDRVAIVDHGKVIALGTPRELIALAGRRGRGRVRRRPADALDGARSRRSPACAACAARGTAWRADRATAARRGPRAARAPRASAARRSRASRRTAPRSRTSSCTSPGRQLRDD